MSLIIHTKETLLNAVIHDNEKAKDNNVAPISI